MHGSPLLGAACMTVLIGGKPAWRIGDQHTCPIPTTHRRPLATALRMVRGSRFLAAQAERA